MKRKKFKKGKILKNIKIEKIGYGGVGISTFDDGKKIVIKGGVLPNSIVNCRVIKEKKDYIDCQLLDYVEIGIDNIERRLHGICPHSMIYLSFNKDLRENFKVGCGGCKWQILPYEIQLNLKQRVFEDSFRFIYDKIKKFIHNILPSPLINGYRNKVEFSFGSCDIKNNLNVDSHIDKVSYICTSSDIIIGFHKQGRWDQVIDIDHCDLISEKANKIYSYFKNFVKKFNIPVYDQKTHQGILRHLVLRQGFNTSQFMLNLVIANKNDLALNLWDEFEKFISNLKQDEFLLSNINTFLLTYNNGLADVVKGENIKTEILRGNGYIFEKLKVKNIEVIFKISPFSFFQTNTFGAQRLFEKAFDVVKFYGKDKYNFGLDLYCGTGTIGILYYKLGLFDNLIGIEIVDEAIESAKENAKLNEIRNFYFKSGKAEKVIFEDKYLKDNINNIDLIIVDPPRDGLHKDVVKFLLNLKKNVDFHLLYISCNPVTLARDINLLIEKFNLKYLQPVDMFPHTHHIENIAFLV